MRSLASGQSGLGLVGVLVSIGLLGIMSVVASQLLTNTQRSAKSTDMNIDLSIIKKSILDAMDCEKTIGTNTQCLPNATFTIKKKNGSNLFPNNTAAGWIISAKCEQKELVVKATTARDHPVYRQVVTKEDIFQGASELCGSIFENPTSAPNDLVQVNCGGVSGTISHFDVNVKTNYWRWYCQLANQVLRIYTCNSSGCSYVDYK